MTPTNVMLFDLFAGGHHGQYVRQLVEFWGENRCEGRLDVVVTSDFMRRHRDVRTGAEAYPNVRLVPVEDPVSIGAGSLLRSSRLHGRLLRRHVTLLRPDHVVAMYFDHLQLALAAGLRFSFPTRISGIYFRPSFHYGTFGGPRPTARDRITGLRKRLLLRAALRNPHFAYLFCLDPYVAAAIGGKRARPAVLPDGVVARPPLVTREEIRARWGVPPNRRAALFFGGVSARKGIHHALEAVRILPAAAAERLCLVIVGHVPDTEGDRLAEGIGRIRSETAALVVLDDRFVDEEEIPGIVGGADLVLLPYRRHVGSSGVLVRAALAGVPALGSDYGLLGEYLRRRRLGMAVDTESAEALSAGLEQWLADPEDFPFDPGEAAHFARENTARAFCETIYGHVMKPRK